MQRVNIETLSSGGDEDAVRWSVSDPLQAQNFAMNYYTLEPGEEFAGTLHAHLDQEETFYVLEGEATFETKPEPTEASKTVTVGQGEAIRFDPGEYQQGRNESDTTVRALALGMPQETTDIRIAAPCQECGESDVLKYVLGGEQPMLQCPECGAEFKA